MAKDLFASGVRTNSENDYAILMEAVESNSYLLVQYLELIFINIFLIHLGKSTEMIQLLIDNDLNLNSKEYYRNSEYSGHSFIFSFICSGILHRMYHHYVFYTAYKYNY